MQKCINFLFQGFLTTWFVFSDRYRNVFCCNFFANTSISTFVSKYFHNFVSFSILSKTSSSPAQIFLSPKISNGEKKNCVILVSRKQSCFSHFIEPETRSGNDFLAQLTTFSLHLSHTLFQVDFFLPITRTYFCVRPQMAWLGYYFHYKFSYHMILGR